MPSPKFLRAQAHRYLHMAAEETDAETARLLQLLADKCLALADAIEKDLAEAPGPVPARASRREKPRTAA